MIEAINTATASAQAATQSTTQTTANTSMQSHAQPFAPAQASPAQAKAFAQHMSSRSPEPARLTAPAAPVAQEPAAAEPNAVRARISQVSKRIESGMAQYERLEGDLQMATDSNDLPKSLRIVGQLAKDTALGHAYMNFGITTTGASVGVFQNLMRVSEK